MIEEQSQRNVQIEIELSEDFEEFIDENDLKACLSDEEEDNIIVDVIMRESSNIMPPPFVYRPNSSPQREMSSSEIDENFIITNVEEAKCDYQGCMQTLSVRKQGKILSEILEEPTLEG